MRKRSYYKISKLTKCLNILGNRKRMINSFAILLLKMPTSFREVSEMALYSFALIWAQKINNNNGHLSTFVKKWANHGLFFVYFRSFQTNFTIFTMNKCEEYTSSIRRRESNPRHLERESLPITTRPGLPPIEAHLFV